MINRKYNTLLFAYFLSSIGDWLYRLALPLLILKLTGSAFDMAIAYAMTFLPFVLVTPFGGVIADRLNRRKILIYGDLAAFGCTLILAIIAPIAKSTWLLDPLVFLIAAFSSLAHPAFQSILPTLVEEKQLAKANSYISSIDNLLTLIGPLFGGGIIAVIGSLNALYLNAISFLLSALLITTLKIQLSSTSSPNKKLTVSNIFRDLKEGLVYVWGHNPVIKYGCLLFVFANFGLQLFYANFMFYLAHFLHLSPQKIGVTLAISGIGAVIGSLIAPYINKYFLPGRLIVACCTLEGLTTLALLGANDSLTVAAIWGLASVYGSITIVTYFTLRQQIIPSEFLGRSIAITRLISYSAIPIASIVGGWLLQQTQSITYLIILGGGIMTLNGVLGWFTPLGRNRRK